MSPYRSAPALPPCPRCSRPLSPLVVLDAALIACAACEGVFVPNALVPRLDPLDLGGEILATFPTRPPASERDVRYLSCPFDGDVMLRRNASPKLDVVVDVCAAHGIWFDRDELRAVIARLDGWPWEGDQLRRLPYGGPPRSPGADAYVADEGLLARLAGWLRRA